MEGNIHPMKKTEVQKLFNDHDKMLHALSHRCSRRCGRPEEEVYGQACYEFMRAVSGYRKERGEFGTYMFQTVKNNLLSWAIKNDLPKDPDLLPELVAQTPSPRRALELKEWLAGLSEECREVARIILDGPAEIMDVAEDALLTRKAVMGALRRYLRKEKGWSWPRIWRVFREMRTAVEEM